MIKREQLKAVLIRDLGIGNLSPEDQDEIVMSVGESILKRIMIKVLELLPKASIAEFETLTKSGDADKLRVFLVSKIPDLDTFTQNIIKESIARYRELAGIK